MQLFNNKSLKLLIALMVILIGIGRSYAGNDTSLVFSNVNVIVMDGDVMGGQAIKSNQMVLIQGNRIKAVGTHLKLPNDVIRIDGKNKYLMPGFAEMHGHIPTISTSEQRIKDILFMYVANGVTTVRGMLGSEGQLDLREAAKKGDIISPTLYLAGPGFGGAVNSAKAASDKVAQQKAEGWDLLKIFPGLSLPVYNAIAAKARELDIDFAGHVPDGVGLMQALKKKQRTIDHLDGYMVFVNGENSRASDDELKKAAQLTKSAGVSVVPTMAIWRTLLKAGNINTLKTLPELKYINKNTINKWVNDYNSTQKHSFLKTGNPQVRHENRMRLLRIMDTMGVKILFGSDAPQQFSVPGFSIHHEIEAMQEAGMSNQAILTSGTAAVGEYFAGKDVFGMVKVGQRADLLLLDANPLENMKNLKNPVGVMVNGRWLSRADIDAELIAIARRAVVN